MVYCDSDLCDASLQPLGRRISDLVDYQSFDDCRQLCVFSRMYGHATLITRDLFEKASPFLEEVPHDGWLAYHATLYGGVLYLPEVLVKYRQHAGNVFGVVGRKKKKDTARSGRKKEKGAGRGSGSGWMPIARPVPNRLSRRNACCGHWWPATGISLPGTISAGLGCSWRIIRLLLAVKNYSAFRKCLFCFKMLVKIK